MRLKFSCPNEIDRETTIYQRDVLTGEPTFYLIKKYVQAISAVQNQKEVTFGSYENFRTIDLPETNVIEIYDCRDSNNNKWYEVPYLAQEMIFIDYPNTEANDSDLYQFKSTVPYVLKTIKTPKRFTTRINQDSTITIEFGAGDPTASDEQLIPNLKNVGLGLPNSIKRLDESFDPTNFLKTKTYGTSPSNTTITVKYYTGGGISSNVAAGELTRINGVEFEESLSSFTRAQLSLYNSAKNSLAVDNDIPAVGGRGGETLEEIRQNSLANFGAQNRAVTATDYETIIPMIYPETESISVFGGEDLSPPRYGKVFISIKPINGTFVSTQVKDNIKNSLKKYSVAGIVPEILDLKYLYVEYDSSVYYNVNSAPSSDYLKTIVSQNINSYTNSTELNKYGARFKYSKFLKLIDDSHVSITSNITKIIIRRDLRPLLNQFADYEICYGNAFHINKMNGYNIKSTAFRVSGISEEVYISDIPDTNRSTGSIFMFTIPNISSINPTIIKRGIGRIDYIKGIITLNPINITSAKIKDGQSIIQISTTPQSNDVIGLQDLYLQLDINNSIFEMVIDEISSGLDPSASNYIVTSSYNNGNLVRV